MSLSFASATNQHAVAIPLMQLVAEQLEKFENSTDVRNPSESSTATVATMATVVLGVKDDCNIRVRNPETNSKLFGLISRRHCRLEVQRVSPCTTRLVLLDGGKAGSVSKNGTFVGDKRVEGGEGVELKDGDVLGLGWPVKDSHFNPYNLVVSDVVGFLEAVSAKMAREGEHLCARCGKHGHETKDCVEVMVKHEQLEGKVSMQQRQPAEPMDVDARGTSGIVDLTLDSEPDVCVPDAAAATLAQTGRVEIVLTESPPRWYKEGWTYLLLDRKLITPVLVSMEGQMMGDEVKLVTVPREFLLDVTMQGVLKDVVVQIEIQSCKKMFITGNSEAAIKALLEAHHSWMRDCYMPNLNEDLIDLIDDLTDDDWSKMTCVESMTPHLALPAVEGLKFVDEDHGARCGMCALWSMQNRSDDIIGWEIRRNYDAESVAFRMLQDRGLMDRLKAVGLTRDRFDFQFSKLLSVKRTNTEVIVPAAPRPAQRPWQRPAPTSARTPRAVQARRVDLNPEDYNPNTHPPARHATMWEKEIGFSVGKAGNQDKCAKCAEELEEDELAFQILTEDTSCMHLRCVDDKLRTRALTDGLRGWGDMEAEQRKEMLRLVTGGGGGGGGGGEAHGG